MSDMTELQEMLDSVRREGALIDRYIDAMGRAGTFDGVTKEEALAATRRFAALVEKSAEANNNQPRGEK